VAEGVCHKCGKSFYRIRFVCIKLLVMNEASVIRNWFTLLNTYILYSLLRTEHTTSSNKTGHTNSLQRGYHTTSQEYISGYSKKIYVCSYIVHLTVLIFIWTAHSSTDGSQLY
jgi:hypothetical protein